MDTVSKGTTTIPGTLGDSLRQPGASAPGPQRAESLSDSIGCRGGVVENRVAELLSNFQPGDERSIEALLPLVYSELKMLATRQLAGESGGGKGHTLQPTALVHEAFLKLAGCHAGWAGREHFMAVASRAMRQVLVDHARRKKSDKRGGGAARADVTLDGMQIADKPTSREVRVVELDALLTQLAATDERTARVAEMRLFGGMELDQIATALGLSRMTIVRDWQVARAWLAAKVQDAHRAEGA